MKAHLPPPKMTNKQFKALEDTIREQIDKNMDKLKGYIEAIMAWYAYDKCNLSVEEIDDFVEGIQPYLQELKDFYDIKSAEDVEFACIYNLKSIGYDTSKLGKAFPLDYKIT